MYLTYKDELTVIDVNYKNTRLVVPQSLRQKMLSRIHYNHLVIEKCKNRAREILFWPGLSEQITNVRNCKACLRHQNALSKESYCERDVPKAACS